MLLTFADLCVVSFKIKSKYTQCLDKFSTQLLGLEVSRILRVEPKGDLHFKVAHRDAFFAFSLPFQWISCKAVGSLVTFWIF